MIHAEAAFCHHLLQIPVAEAVAQVPANAEDDDLILLNDKMFGGFVKSTGALRT
jgi:hypothetical protein